VEKKGESSLENARISKDYDEKRRDKKGGKKKTREEGIVKGKGGKNARPPGDYFRFFKGKKKKPSTELAWEKKSHKSRGRRVKRSPFSFRKRGTRKKRAGRTTGTERGGKILLFYSERQKGTKLPHRLLRE